MDIKERLVELKQDYGLNNKEIVQIILDECGTLISEDMVRYHTVRKFKPKKKTGKQKVLLMSDLHAPFHRKETILSIVEKHKHEIHAIIFVGDLVDCESISKFPKELRIPLIEEMVVTYNLLKEIDDMTPDIPKIIIWGNHEYRFVKYLAEQKSEFNPMHSDNIIKEIVKGFTHYDRKKDEETVYPPLSSNFKVVNKWYCLYGDLIVAHPKNFSSVKLKTVTKTVEHFIKKGLQFNSLFIGHTHKWGSTTEFGKWCGELGCLCKPMEYADNGNINYTPQEYGYAIVTQVNGVTDINKSRLYQLDLEEGEVQWAEENDQS